MSDPTQHYQSTIDQLRTCYNTHAQKFSSTRKKHRPEFERIAEKIMNDEGGMINDHLHGGKENKLANSPTLLKTGQAHQLSIIELGCGDGRLFGYLTEQGIQIKKYIGIDIADNFIAQAKKTYADFNNTSWSVDDMIHGLSMQKAESADCVICVASFHHLPNNKTRELLLQQVYRVLKYGGKFITIDRSRSHWMLKKHRKPLCQAIRSSLLSAGRNERNNLMIPFKDNTNKHSQPGTGGIQGGTNRLYHIFSRPELSLLLKTHGFVINEMIYSSQSGQFHHQRPQARNICTLVSKNIFVKNENKVNNNKNLHSSS